MSQQSRLQTVPLGGHPPTWRLLIDSVGAQNLSLIVALAVLVAIFGTAQAEIFFQPRNLTNILNAVAILGLIASAQTIVIISGGIDVSVGSIVGVSGVAAALAMLHTDFPPAGIAAAVIVATLCGLTNGVLVTAGRVNAIIATLATMAIFRGLAYILTNGRGIGIISPAYNWIGSGRLLGTPIAVFVFVIIASVLVFFMRSTDLGRNIYAIGGNPNAAKLVGIDVQKYRLGVYTLTGLICGIAAVLLTARTTSGQPASGSEGLELEFDHRLVSRRVRHGWREGHYPRDNYRGAHHWHPQQRHGPHASADILSAHREGGAAARRCDAHGVPHRQA